MNRPYFQAAGVTRKGVMLLRGVCPQCPHDDWLFDDGDLRDVARMESWLARHQHPTTKEDR